MNLSLFRLSQLPPYPNFPFHFCRFVQSLARMVWFAATLFGWQVYCSKAQSTKKTIVEVDKNRDKRRLV